MNTSELLLCPFCGGSNVGLRSGPAGHWVACISCGLEAPTETGVTPEQAVTYWNTRPTPSDGAREALAETIHKAPDQAWRDSDWLGLSASEKACYHWPEDSDLHRQCRAAYIAGATDYAAPQSADGESDLKTAHRRIQELQGENDAIRDKLHRAQSPVGWGTELEPGVMAAAEKAAEVVDGWSDAKKDYAARAVTSTERS